MNEKIRQQIDDLAYRLRCETKRTDLPEGIVRTYAEAYYAIGILQEECREAEDLRRRVKELKEGFEGCCMACEPVGEMNRQLQKERDEARLASVRFMEKMADILNDEANAEIEQLRKERDEARREILESLHPDLRESYAAAREWDYLKENTNG